MSRPICSEASVAMSHPGLRFEVSEDLRTVVAPGLRLSFRRAGDRWTHDLRAEADPPVEVAASVEGDPARDDPARVVSPVYQDIQDLPVQEGACILLTGQSTPHHFSAVVTARHDGLSVTFEVDIADRCRSPVEVLAATYLVHLGSGDLIDAGPERIVWGGKALGHGRLEFHTAGGVDDVALAEAGRRASRVQALAKIDPATHTQRLFYTWRWTPGGGPPAEIL